ncbi:MAG TPA: cbb3-type cytochrome c oxidase N-terminal domain-containing protein [Nitrospiria bacterium]|nr:cbb3-type cytochrome c oxidase N-terminal domain-containing protein [Nitrospiria bacterium]
MTAKTEKSGNVQSKGAQEIHVGDEVYLYKDSGIRERHGVIPLWLQLVSYGLIIWGIYYTIRYWSTG